MKISIIMQVYLGKYPGSRSNADVKFMRAVQSFISQGDKNSELIIVSDGCEKVHKLYYDNYKSVDNIKYVYIDKDTPNMYEGEEKYYRGFPRQIGRTMATGFITTYMDSDDFLIPNSIRIIRSTWEKMMKANEDITWSMTSQWIDNEAAIELWKPSTSTETFGDTFKIDGLDGMWTKVKMTHETLVMSATWSMCHLSSLPVKWEDCIGSPSEDTRFSVQMHKIGKGFVMSEPYYVRCHYTDWWDY